jgi:hypothetical protein
MHAAGSCGFPAAAETRQDRPDDLVGGVGWQHASDLGQLRVHDGLDVLIEQ